MAAIDKSCDLKFLEMIHKLSNFGINGTQFRLILLHETTQTIDSHDVSTVHYSYY